MGSRRANTDQALVCQATPDAAAEGQIVKKDPNTKQRKMKKPRYNRREGDELSLPEKRQIASRRVVLRSPACGWGQDPTTGATHLGSRCPLCAHTGPARVCMHTYNGRDT